MFHCSNIVIVINVFSPCVTTIAACLEALQSIQHLIQDLQWPDKDVNCHLQQRCLTICSEQLRYCTSTWAAFILQKLKTYCKCAWPTGQWGQLDLVIGGDTTLHTFEMRLPQQAFSMLCSLCYLQEHVSSYLNKLSVSYIFSGWKTVTAYWSGIGNFC